MKLGEGSISNEDGQTALASHGEPLAAVLTLIRACESAREVTFGPFGLRLTQNIRTVGDP